MQRTSPPPSAAGTANRVAEIMRRNWWLHAPRTQKLTQHTPGPWVWEGGYTLRPANPQPQRSSVHTILQLESSGCGYLGSRHQDTHAELEADRALIAAAPILYDAIDCTLRTAKLDPITARILRQALEAAHVDVPEGVAV